MDNRKVDPMFRDYKPTKEQLLKVPEYDDIDAALAKQFNKRIFHVKDAEMLITL